MDKIEFYTVKDIKEILRIGKNKVYALCNMELFPIEKWEIRHLFIRKNLSNG